MRVLATFAALICLLVADFAAAKERVIPSGNRNARQPQIPTASATRTVAKRSTFERKYARVVDLLERDRNLQSRILQVSKAYEIDPIHIVGALVGEHTFNVDVYDTFQTYLVKAASYAGDSFQFEYNGEHILDFVARPEFETCSELTGSYAIWSCREDIWEKRFRDKRVDGVSFPNNRMSAVFFQPFFAGQTFGLGQLNPLTALKLTDTVRDVSPRYRKLDADDAQNVYRAIMDPNTTISYMGAAISTSIEAYKKHARVDISQNPGLTATLYNLGNPEARAIRHRRSGRYYPRENYYGWFVNDKEDELRAIIERW